MPQTVGATLAALAPRYALTTLRQQLASIARAHRAAGHPLDAGHPAVRETLRGIARRHGTPQRRTAALATPEIRHLVAGCGGDPTGLRDRTLRFWPAQSRTLFCPLTLLAADSPTFGAALGDASRSGSGGCAP